MDKLREECGIFGISNHQDSSALVALGLHALQHRGQEGCGIVSFDGKNYHSEKRQGLVGDNFTNKDVLKKLPGKLYPFFLLASKTFLAELIKFLINPSHFLLLVHLPNIFQNKQK